MTVCIAAVAAQIKAIVLVADKSVSYVVQGHTTQKFDVAFRKIRPMDVTGWAALISGPMDFGERVIHLADEIFHVQEGEVQKTLPECVKIAYQICRKIEIVDRVLSPRLLTEKWYDEKVKDPVSEDDDFFIAISKEIDDFDNESSVLLCGFENGTPEIYLITNPGVLGSESPAGLAAIGIGQETALHRLYSLETDPGDPLEKVLYDAFDAKEACSESLPEVGREWDAMVIVENAAAIEVPDPIRLCIEQVYDNHPKSPFPLMGGPELPSPPEDWRKMLEEWAATTLAASGAASSGPSSGSAEVS